MAAMPDRPLAGRRIAVTRPDAGELGRTLTELGADVVHVPLIEIADPADGGAALADALDRLESFDWLVVTSANAARRVGAAVASVPRVRVAAVGSRTAKVLAKLAERAVDVVPDVQRVEGLLAAFPSEPSHVLVAQADRAGPALADGLTAAGHDVESVVAYRTVGRTPSDNERSALNGLDAVVFASGSAVAAWCDAGALELPSVVVAIGPSTERAARRRGVAVTHTASAPTASSLSAVLVDALP